MTFAELTMARCVDNSFRAILNFQCAWWLSGLIFSVVLRVGKFVIPLSNSWTYLDVFEQSIFQHTGNGILNSMTLQIK